MAVRTDSTRWRALPAAMHNPLSTLPEFLGWACPDAGLPPRRPSFMVGGFAVLYLP
jgi:hypothetical protein